ncbi:MAG TPA: hypothetical protein VFQ35_04440 [Polyangiaceae bacterium]|nr:hypothetical protein [Polyangiaceae bacterium]
MSIDGIGRPPGGPGGAGGVGSLGGAAKPTPGGESFQVQRSAAAPSASSDPLSRLQSGEITVDQYLDARVDEAVAPLVSKLPAEALEHIRSSLREQLESDPTLVELVRRATSAAPPGSTET